MEEPKKPDSKNKQKVSINFSLNYKIISIVLVVLLILSIALWRPWVRDAENRVINVTGEATVTAEADEFIFYPNWMFTAATEQEGLTQVAAKSTEVVTKLKELGVPEQNIKVTSSGTDSIGMYYPEREAGSDITYYLNIQVTTTSKEQAQTVQDYLITTAPTGSITPQGGFSDSKQKELESQARDEATKDARNKADQTAGNLGFKVGKVKTVSDLTPGYGVYPMMDTAISSSVGVASDKIAVMPGTNDLNYTITVEYYIK